MTACLAVPPSTLRWLFGLQCLAAPVLLQVADSKDGPEQLSVDRALRAIRRAEVVVAVVDASEGITQQVRAPALACT